MKLHPKEKRRSRMNCPKTVPCSYQRVPTTITISEEVTQRKMIKRKGLFYVTCISDAHYEI